MIEYKNKTCGNKWRPWPWASSSIKIASSHFEDDNIRINGVIFKEYTPEFLEAYEKAIFWEMLSD